ncbi:GspH/FimT family pseudopilin [Pseudoalteromonas sp. Hal040]|uniref:GspH/FimT family pseudopilin n=1 Tax=unclassified Pseudoalteromonas TaxID=194690 RepID=UPI00301BD0A3
MKSLQRGFTLLELMVTLAIVGIVAVIALWDSSDMLENDRAESYLLELKRTLSFARAKATSSDELVIVCAGDTKAIEQNKYVFCSRDWSQGSVFVFVDKSPNGTFNPGRGDIILRVMAEIPENSSLRFSESRVIRFETSGMIRTDPGTFVYCPSKSSNDNNKALSISKSGTAMYEGTTTKTCN